MIQYDSYIYPILLSYIIGGFIVTLSVIYLDTPRFFSKIKSWLLFSAIYSLIGIMTLPLLKYLMFHTIVICTSIFLLIRILYSDSLIRVLVTSFYLIAVSFGAEFICAGFFHTLLSLEAYDDFAGNNLYMLVGITFTNMSLLLLTATFPAIWWIFKSYRHTREFFLYSLFPLYQFISFCICMYLFKKPSLHMVYVGNVFLIFGVITDIILLFSLDNLLKKRQQQAELEVLDSQQKKEYNYYLQIQNQLNQHRIIKHEFANQLATIYAMSASHASPDEMNQMIMASSEYLDNCSEYSSAPNSPAQDSDEGGI